MGFKVRKKLYDFNTRIICMLRYYFIPQKY